MVIVDLIVGINIKIDSICKNSSYFTLRSLHNMLIDGFVLVVVLVVCLCTPVACPNT